MPYQNDKAKNTSLKKKKYIKTKLKASSSDSCQNLSESRILTKITDLPVELIQSYLFNAYDFDHQALKAPKYFLDMLNLAITCKFFYEQFSKSSFVKQQSKIIERNLLIKSTEIIQSMVKQKIEQKFFFEQRSKYFDNNSLIQTLEVLKRVLVLLSSDKKQIVTAALSTLNYLKAIYMFYKSKQAPLYNLNLNDIAPQIEMKVETLQEFLNYYVDKKFSLIREYWELQQTKYIVLEKVEKCVKNLNISKTNDLVSLKNDLEINKVEYKKINKKTFFKALEKLDKLEHIEENIVKNETSQKAFTCYKQLAC